MSHLDNSFEIFQTFPLLLYLLLVICDQRSLDVTIAIALGPHELHPYKVVNLTADVTTKDLE